MHAGSPLADPPVRACPYHVSTRRPSRTAGSARARPPGRPMSRPRHAGAGRPVGAGAVVVTAATGQAWLQATFATVRHPVTLGVANTTADAETVRGWYRVLLAQGTFDRMVATELVDLVWVSGVAATAVLLTVLAARLLERRNRRRPGCCTESPRGPRPPPASTWSRTACRWRCWATAGVPGAARRRARRRSWVKLATMVAVRRGCAGVLVMVGPRLPRRWAWRASRPTTTGRSNRS